MRSRLLFSAFVAVMLLAMGASTAAASRSFSVVGGGRAFLAIANGTRRLTFEDLATGLQVIQLVTLHGSIHSLIAKSIGALVGVINRVSIGPREECRDSLGVECQAFALVPASGWHLQLLSFTGTLPRIASIEVLIVEAEFLLRIGTTECLYRGTAGGIGTTTEDRRGGQTITTLVANEEKRISLFRVLREEFFRPCGEQGRFRGTFGLSTPITIRLH